MSKNNYKINLFTGMWSSNLYRNNGDKYLIRRKNTHD